MNDKTVFWAPTIAAFLMFLSVATTLRFSGAAIGVVEVFILILATAVACKRRLLVLGINNQFVWFWLCFIVVAVLGYLTGSEHGAGVLHTGGAYLYMLVFTFVMVVGFSELGELELRNFIRAVVAVPVVLLVIPLLLFLYDAVRLSEWLLINTSYYPSRLSAWSENPNQLAFLLLPIPIWLAAISQRAQWTAWQTIRCFLSLFLVFFLGFCVRSDALLLAWAVSVFLLVVLGGWWQSKFEYRLFLIVFAAFMLAFLLFKGVVDKAGRQYFESGLMQGSHTAGDRILSGEAVMCDQQIKERENLSSRSIGRSDSAVGVGLDPNKFDARMGLWRNAVTVWKLSPLFGHGPGAFSYLMAPNEKQEAHNLLLDLLTQVGVVGVALFMALYLRLLVAAVRVRDSFSVAVLIALMIFSLAHFMLRQPIFMLFLVVTAMIVKKRLFVGGMK